LIEDESNLGVKVLKKKRQEASKIKDKGGRGRFGG